jgi:sulfite reductase (NADPH) flavoprotein alpha-component
LQLEVRKAPEAPSPVAGRLAIFFGTHSGSCEAIARSFATSLTGVGLAASCFDLDEFAHRHVADGVNIIITSSYGDGDPPANAERFAAWIDKGDRESLRGVKYAVFALGDRNYAQFCGFGRKVDERLAALGADRLLVRAECETGKADYFSQWSRPVLSELGIAEPKPAAVPEKARPLHQSTTYMLSGRRALTPPQSPRSVYHVELFDADAGQDYEPGDSIAVNPVNALEAVLRMVAEFGFDVADKVELRETRCTLLEALLFRKELRMLDAQPSSPLHTPQQLVDALRPMTPRHFSIASSRSHVPTGAHLTIALTEFEAAGRQKTGLASGYLTRNQGIGALIHGSLRRNPRFRLPGTSSAPVIMIGPGTGVAPFRAFLQSRQMAKARGLAWLFFGNRNRDHDYLYREEIEAFHADGVLKNLSLAFSRDQDHKIYVQHLMIERGREIWSWIMRGAHIYVCGDAKHMAGDVHDALIKIIATHARLPTTQGEKMLADLVKKGRYQRDVY